MKFKKQIILACLDLEDGKKNEDWNITLQIQIDIPDISKPLACFEMRKLMSFSAPSKIHFRKFPVLNSAQ